MEVLALEKQLRDTKSRKFRSYDLVHVGGDIAEYVMVFRQGKPGLKSYESTAYAVQVEEEPQLPFAQPGTYYLIAKVEPDAEDKDRHEVYRCFIPAHNKQPGRCTCIGQNTQKVCKHVDALRDAAHGSAAVPLELIECP